MLGFEVRINEKEPVFIAAEQVAFVLLYSGNLENRGEIIMKGTNLTESFTWLNSVLEKGDKIHVRVVETEKPSCPVDICEQSRENLLERYEYLRNKLKIKEVIK